jgi:TolB-like protein/Tfp pilus assembly protein PilF
MLSPAPSLSDRYTIEREIGQGGMATVYLATDNRHNRAVAIKVLRPEIELGVDRFHREVQIVAGLSHPHILALYDSGEAADGRLFYVMPYVKGQSLRERIEHESQLPVDDAVSLIRKVAFALSYAHSQGIIHRDIKPENILLHEQEPMLADFGIALACKSAADARITGSGLVVGTPAYMSPEQAMGEHEPDARSDVYSLACVLFELLTGAPPYTGPTAMSVMTQRLIDPPPPVRRLRASVPLAVEQALARALAKLPADRFPSAAAFADALVTHAVARPRAPVVAVLPFLSLSADKDNEYFADGITEDVITHLSKLRTVDVIARASVMAFKDRATSLRDIGARLNAGSLLDGSVRRAGNRVRIVAQLIDAVTEQSLWAETYDRELTDIFAIQTDVALQIANALRAELSADEHARIHQAPTDDVQAYQLYLQGRHFVVRYTPEGMSQGARFFEQSIELDPDFALAHAALAMVTAELAESGSVDPAVAFPRAWRAVERALALDPNLADAHCALGHLKATTEFDWTGAEACFKRALALQPGNADALDVYGRILSSLERFDEALVLQLRAQELDPLVHRLDVSSTLLRAGRFQEALDAARRVVELNPHYDRAHATLGWACFKLGNTDAGIAELERAVTLSPNNWQWLAQYGQALGHAGRTGEARAVLARVQRESESRYVSPYHFAYLYTGLGEHDTAIEWLERAYGERAGAIYGIKGSFLFAPLRNHPRFVQLLRLMNLG